MSEIIKNNLPYERLQIDSSLHLRQLGLQDAERVFSLVDDNREYLRQWLPFVDGTKSVQDSKEFISKMIEQRRAGAEYGYAIVVDGDIVGHISLMHLLGGQEPEIGYWIANGASGKGVTTKAAKELTDFGFNTLKLPKIIIRADPDNIPSNRVAEKLGYKLERIDDQTPTTSSLNVWAKINESP